MLETSGNRPAGSASVGNGKSANVMTIFYLAHGVDCLVCFETVCHGGEKVRMTSCSISWV